MRHAAAILLACFVTPAVAQIAPIRLPDGATWTITAEHTRRAEGAGQAQNWSLTTVKRLTWHAGGNGKPNTLTVTPVSAVPGAGSSPEVAIGRSLAIPAVLVVDQSLTPGDVVNRDEVRAEFRRLVPSAPKDSTDLIDAATKAMIASELVIASRAQGLELQLKKPRSAEIGMPNPLGGQPLRATEIVQVEAVDIKNGRAVVKWRQALDPESFKASAAAILTTMAQGKVEPAKIEAARAAFATASMINETECFYEIDLPTGLARRGECFVDFAVNLSGKTQKASDHWVISQTMPGAS